MRLSGPSSGRLSTGDRSSVSQRLPYPSFVAALFLKPGGPLKGRTLLSRQKGDPAICHSVAGPAVVTLMRRLRQRRSCLGVGFKKAELIKEARLDAAEVGVRWRDGGKCSGGHINGAGPLPVRPRGSGLPVLRGRGRVPPGWAAFRPQLPVAPEEPLQALGGVTPWACVGPPVVLRAAPLRLRARRFQLILRVTACEALWEGAAPDHPQGTQPGCLESS